MKDDRKYQQDARHRVNQEWNNRREPLLVMPAGSGKTYTAALIVKDRIILGDRLLILVGVIDIFDQWIVEFSNHNIDYGYIADGKIYGQNKPVYICMWKTLNNMLPFLPEKFTRTFTKIIIDEVHRASCTTLREIFCHFEACLKLGLTATPIRGDNQPLGEFFNVLYEPITQQEAIAKGFLCDPIILLPEDYKNVIEKLENKEIEISDIIKEKTIIGNPFEMYKRVFDGQPVMIACDGYKHSKEICKKFRSYGWAVEHIHGLLEKPERRRIIKDIRKGKLNILVTYNVGAEGLDVPNLMGVIWLTLTRSLNKWIQLNTRAARKDKNNKNKTEYILIDMCGNLLLHKSPAIDRKWDLYTSYEPEDQDDEDYLKMQICPCGVANSVLLTKCWICGYDFETGLDKNGNVVDKNKRKLPKMIEGKLVFLEGEDESKHDACNSNDMFNSNYTNRNNISNVSGESENKERQTDLTQAEKINILNKNLTGLNRNDEFRKNVGWL